MWKFIKESFGRRVWLWLFVMALAVLILLAPSPFSRAQPESPESSGSSAPLTPTLSPNGEEGANNRIYLLTLDDEIISPITANYIKNGIDQAYSERAEAVVIELDTPGGLLSSTHTIVKDILNAPIPVIVYVSPSGARAGSAGVFITMASHIAAMAPFTRIGAAHPVDAGGNWPATSPPDEKDEEPLPTPEIMSQKILNDTVAAIRSIAKARGRNEEWAVKAVTESASITAEEALAKNVIDIVAPDLHSLLKEINGKKINVAGKSETIDLEFPQVVEYEFTAQQKFLSLLTHPFLSYILLMIGFYGLLFEVTHPGIGFAGIIGGISLILALMGMQAMSINMAGLGLMALGLVLFITEVFTPTFGAFFAGGLLCLILGTVLLYQTGEPYLLQVIPYMITISTVVGLFTGFLLWKVLKTYKTKAKGPYDKLIGQIGEVILAIGPESIGKIRVYGEVWDAQSEESLETGSEIQVVAINPIDCKILRVVRLKREVP